MKKFRKIMAVLVAAMMIISSFTLTAWATPTTDYQIVIDNAVKGETYKAYKIFDVTYTTATNASAGALTNATTIPGVADPRNEHKSYAYTISESSEWFTVLTTNIATKNEVTASPAGTPTKYTLTTFGLELEKTTTTGIWNVKQSPSDMTTAQSAALAAYLAENADGKHVSNQATANAEDTATTSDYKLGKVTIDLGSDEGSEAPYLGEGYYFVTTTTGSFCSLDTTEPKAYIREKNSIPSATKTVTDGEATGSHDNAAKTETSVKTGDEVTFKIDITNSKGTNKKIIVDDTISDGLTVELDTLSVKVDGTAVEVANYTVKYLNSMPKKGTPASNVTGVDSITGGYSMEFEFTDAYISGLAESKVINIEYKAILNENAETASPFETNKMVLKYSNQTTHEEVTTVKTYYADVVKTDDASLLLDGATFKLYNAVSGGTEYQLVKTATDGVYYIKGALSGTVATELEPAGGKLKIKGLEPGKYYLEEVDHPDGYYPLTARVEFEITDSNLEATTSATAWTAGGVKVVNTPGKELPSTGGMGTTVLYIVGGMLVILAGAYLFFSRKKTA